MSEPQDQLAETIAAQAADKKAIDVVELDVRGVVELHGLLLVCSGNTDAPGQGDPRRHPPGAQGRARHPAAPRRGRSARRAGSCMDYLDVVVHIFTPEARDFYRLEQLWGEVPARDDGARRGLSAAAGRAPAAHTPVDARILRQSTRAAAGRASAVLW